MFSAMEFGGPEEAKSVKVVVLPPYCREADAFEFND